MNANNYKLKCPECNELVANDPRGLATHRRFKHGVRGVSAAAVNYRKARAKKEIVGSLTGATARPRRKEHLALQCPECHKEGFATHETLARHRANFHNVPVNTKQQRRELAKTTQNAATQLTTRNGQPTAPPQDDGDHRIQAAATFASGRVAQLLESIALQHDLPFKPFAALVLRTVAHTAQVR